MDHLPALASRISQEQETVPYVCTKAYDEGPFLTYPIREGKPQALPALSVPGNLHFWQYEQHHPTPKQELEAFLQTWLFFGLVSEILGTLCRSEDFVRTKDNGKKILSTATLCVLL